MYCTLRLCLLLVVFQSFRSWSETAEEALVRATAAVKEAIPRAQADPARPIFHVMTPAQWMNDPNGPIFYKGYYHLFYQLHPFSDKDGPKYWGHVKSRDLVKWEHLPIAVAPSNDKGEEAIWSGSCTINGFGQPMIFYTSIAQGKSAFDHAEQWAATSDDGMIHWQKSPANPVLSEALHGERKIYDWRDPFVFHEGRKTFLVTGGHLAKQGEAAVNIYEAQNEAFTQWTYRGVLYQIPGAPTAECPNFFKLDNQWVLFVSPYGKVQYFIGDFDIETCRFKPRSHGLVDYGPNFYAPNTMQLSDGNRLVWGWVTGFSSGYGWNGCLSLPRKLSITGDGKLRQVAAPQLAKLRGKPEVWRNLHLQEGTKTFQLPRTNALEIFAEIDLNNAKQISFEFKNDSKDSKPVVIAVELDKLRVGDGEAILSLGNNSRKRQLRIFIDRSVLEVCADDTIWITKEISPIDSDAPLTIKLEGGDAALDTLQAWPVKTIWQF